MLGIISGTVSLMKGDRFKNIQQVVKANEFGKAIVLLSDAIAFIPRHGNDPGHYILPHLINHRANLKALHDIGVSEVIGINSTGSLSNDLKPGTIVIPEDFIMLSPYPSIYVNMPAHITPGLNRTIRQRFLEAALESGIEVVDGGIYWQTCGPRLETRAEITMMSQFADVVGMTMASEAIIANELELPYAAICSVDNYAHGIGEEELTMKDISSHASSSGEIILRILSRYIEKRMIYD